MISGSAPIGALSILCMCVTLLICFGLPIGLAIWGKLHYKKAFSFLPLLAGVLGFFISQILFRLTLIQAVLPQLGWYRQFMQMQWPYSVFLCFTAGLVEEPARFICFTIMKKRRGFADGLSYGIGHGGIEAILIVGLSYLSNIIISMMIDLHSPEASMIPADVVSVLTNSSPGIFLVAGLERIFAVLLHIALSLVVLNGFQTNRKALYLFISFLLHGSANFLAIVATQIGSGVMPASPQLGGAIFAEGFLFIVAVLSVLFIVKQAREWRQKMQGAAMMQPDTGEPRS
jgi:uncharacterized membrane protein YhfC